jgi:hypothetical protein
LDRFLFSFFFLRFFLRSEVSDPDELEELEPEKKKFTTDLSTLFIPLAKLAGKRQVVTGLVSKYRFSSQAR